MSVDSQTSFKFAEKLTLLKTYGQHHSVLPQKYVMTYTKHLRTLHLIILTLKIVKPPAWIIHRPPELRILKYIPILHT